MADRLEVVKTERSMIAGPVKISAFRVRDAETGEFGPMQFHMVYGDMVVAVMPESAAYLFSRFVGDMIGLPPAAPPVPMTEMGEIRV